ncbi:ABC transporter substrate-binding protein [Brachybacterium sp. AOP43-C2-M15]|uniref:ABC transporter substrate-binding protein n=1 Tax=Brachybacterium sp. AOP43-C2-M15 TaxID=3457661 RepID=UPI004033D491
MQSRSTPPPRRHRPAPLDHPLTRRSFASLAGAAAAAGLAGCATQSTAKDLDTLQVWGGVPPESGPQALVDHFMEKHPEQKVVYTRFVNDDRGNLKVNTALQGGVDIDVFFTYDSSNLAMRSESGMAADISELVRSTPEFEPFLDTAEPKALFDGEAITALATTKEPNFLLINESIREEVGIDLPRAWELDEFLEAVRAFATPDRYGTYKLPDLPRIELGPDHWYAEGGGSNFEHPAFLRHFELTAQMIREGTIFPWSQVLARQIEAYQQNNFIAEDFAIWGTAPFSLRFLSDPVEYPHEFLTSCAPMPTIDGADWNSGMYGNYIQVNAKSPKQEAAREFVKFWLLEGAADMAPGGKIPTLDNVDSELLLDAVLGEDKETYFEVDSFRRTLFDDDPRLYSDTDLTAVAEITHTYEQQRDVCWLLERSPERTIRTIHSDADALIERFGEG